MYTIKVLKDDDFAKAASSDYRYQNVNEDNDGFADPDTNTAYVRYSVYPELNKYLIEHEFEHLIEEHGTDQDEFGIRHRKKARKHGFGDWIRGLSTAGATNFGRGGRQEEANATRDREMFGSSFNPFGGFNVGGSSSGRYPEILAGGGGGGLTDLQLPAEELERRRGFYSGRSF
mgnify:CR=1 FL=1